MYDSLNREHILNVKFNNDLPEFSTEFPRIINFEWHEVINYCLCVFCFWCNFFFTYNSSIQKILFFRALVH
jgi:hypothetical protein